MNYHHNIMTLCIDLHKNGYIFTAPVLRCKSNEELQLILNRLNCLKRTIEKCEKDSVSITENYKKDSVQLIERHKNECIELEKQIELSRQKLKERHENEKKDLEIKHDKSLIDNDNLRISILEEVKKMNTDFIDMNKQTEKNVLLEDEYEKLCGYVELNDKSCAAELNNESEVVETNDKSEIVETNDKSEIVELNDKSNKSDVEIA